MGERVELTTAEVAKVPFLVGLPSAHVEAVLKVAQLRTYEADQTVFQEEDPGSELYVILDGEVVVEKATDVGGSRVLGRLEPGTVLGEINFLLGEERTASAKATQPTRLLALRREDFDQLEDTGSAAVANLMATIARVLAMRLKRIDEEIANLCTDLADVEDRSAEKVRAMSERRSKLFHEWDF